MRATVNETGELLFSNPLLPTGAARSGGLVLKAVQSWEATVRRAGTPAGRVGEPALPKAAVAAPAVLQSGASAWAGSSRDAAPAAPARQASVPKAKAKAKQQKEDEEVEAEEVVCAACNAIIPPGMHVCPSCWVKLPLDDEEKVDPLVVAAEKRAMAAASGLLGATLTERVRPGYFRRKSEEGRQKRYEKKAHKRAAAWGTIEARLRADPRYREDLIATTSIDASRVRALAAAVAESLRPGASEAASARVYALAAVITASLLPGATGVRVGEEGDLSYDSSNGGAGPLPLTLMFAFLLVLCIGFVGGIFARRFWPAIRSLGGLLSRWLRTMCVANGRPMVRDVGAQGPVTYDFKADKPRYWAQCQGFHQAGEMEISAPYRRR